MTAQRVRIVVSDPDDLPEISSERLLGADAYLDGRERSSTGLTVVNLCRSYRYRTKGYYVSLLADARGHRVIPPVEAIEGLSESFAVFRVLREAGIPTVDLVEMRARRLSLPTTIPAEDDAGEGLPGRPTPLLRVAGNGEMSMRPAGDAEFEEALAYFGACADPRFRAAAEAVYREWPYPVLRLQFVREEEEWRVAHVAAVSVRQLSTEERVPLVEALRDERRVLRRGSPLPRALKRASIAVLVDEQDPFSPSSSETLDRLERVAGRMNVYVHRIGLDEIERLGEYDALFIRALTGVREPAFQFALRAEMLDMPVIDDPQSIIRCSNKVFLEELLGREGIPTPRTRVITSRTPWDKVAELGCPVVVKLPDGSFSSAVHKCGSAEEYQRVAAELARRSPLLIAQEYLPTEFDWRVTVLDGKVLFTARYFMAQGHWQIRSQEAGAARYGRVEAVPRERAPRPVVQLALRAAALIGTGLYGVDLKETPNGPVVIEVNDNPNLDIGYDDAADGSVIYEDLVGYFLRRIEEVPAPRKEERPARERSARQSASPARRHYRPFEVAGMELEYAVVDRDLNAVPLVEEGLRALAGRPTSDVSLEHVAFSNEIAGHVLELKTPLPTRSLREAEEALVDGVSRFSALLHDRFAARLLPTGMHPWLDPKKARIWTRSNARIYQAYARLFDVYSHGWVNVHAAHLNLPLGREDEAIAMYNAAALLVPYLPALAASSPMYDGELQEAVDNRLDWILRHQQRIPESQGEIVPEYVEGFSDYRKRILGSMYRALDRLPGAGVLRHEFFNARGAVFKFSRQSMEVRVIDTQECVKLDVAVAVFVRSTLHHLARQFQAGKLMLPAHPQLVEDFRACIRRGSEARVRAPHLGTLVERDAEGRAPVRDVLRALLGFARRTVRKDDADYLELVERMIVSGTLSERIRAALERVANADDETFTEAARRIYIELADCLVANEPWKGRWG